MKKRDVHTPGKPFFFRELNYYSAFNEMKTIHYFYIILINAFNVYSRARAARSYSGT